MPIGELARYSATKSNLTLQSARDERLDLPIGLLSDKDQSKLWAVIDALPLAPPQIQLTDMSKLQRRTLVRTTAVMSVALVVGAVLANLVIGSR